MREYAITLTLDTRISVTDQFIASLRNMAVPHPEDLTFRLDPFLAEMNALHADDNDFTKAVLANGIRKMARTGLVELLNTSGVVATVAPATIAYVDTSGEVNPNPAEPTAEDIAKQAEIDAKVEQNLNALLSVPQAPASPDTEAQAPTTPSEDAGALLPELVLPAAIAKSE